MRQPVSHPRRNSTIAMARATSAGCSAYYAPGRDVARLAYFGLYALQHRGQESAGIATCEGGPHHHPARPRAGLPGLRRGEAAGARRRHGDRPRPLLDHRRRRLGERPAGLARRRPRAGARPQRQPDQRGRAPQRADARRGSSCAAPPTRRSWPRCSPSAPARATSWIEDAVAEVMPRLEGAFSTVVMTKHAVVAFRDPHGVRPLALGKIKADDGHGECFVVASESCAFDIIGAKLIREVQPGRDGLADRRRPRDEAGDRGRAARPTASSSTSTSRGPTRGSRTGCCRRSAGRMGEMLWEEAPVDADLVISVPDSGNPAANGFARASGLPKDDGLIKNRYVARTFIQPGQELRKHGLRMKFNPLPEIVAGKRVVVVDDSIVRGNTTRQIVGDAEGGGREGGPPADLLAADPPSLPLRDRHVDPRGDDRPRPRRSRRSPTELGADSLAYLSMDGVYEAVGTPRERHCDACFTGDYPLGDPESANGKFALEEIAVVPRLASFAPRERLPHRRPRLGHRHQPAGDPRPAPRPRRDRGRRRSPPTSRARRRWSGPQAPGSRPGSSRAADYADREARDAAIGRLARRSGDVDLVVLAGYMQLLSPSFVERFREPDRQRPPGAAALVPRPRRGRAGARRTGSRITGVTVHFVDEGVDSGPIILQRPVAGARRAATGTSSRRRSTRPSTSCCPRRSG